MTDQQRAAMQAAIDCLVGVAIGKYDGNAAEVSANLRAALARQEHGEPVENLSKCVMDARNVIEECRAALEEELAAWDINPPLHHIKKAHDGCVAWLAAQGAALAQQCKPWAAKAIR